MIGNIQHATVHKVVTRDHAHLQVSLETRIELASCREFTLRSKRKLFKILVDNLETKVNCEIKLTPIFYSYLIQPHAKKLFRTQSDNGKK